eukprot:gene9169-24268_t
MGDRRMPTTRAASEQRCVREQRIGRMDTATRRAAKKRPCAAPRR